jgi:hypothetical protein
VPVWALGSFLLQPDDADRRRHLGFSAREGCVVFSTEFSDDGLYGFTDPEAEFQCP